MECEINYTKHYCGLSFSLSIYPGATKGSHLGRVADNRPWFTIAMDYISYLHLHTILIVSVLIVSVHIHYYMWQSQVEIKHHSVAYFDRVTAFEAL